MGPVHVIVTTDRPGSSLCPFLRTALWAGFDVTLLGWAPSSPPRWQEWYLGSKPLAVADYLGRCRHSGDGSGENSGVRPDATIVVTDADVLVNAASPQVVLVGI
jgi:hypothetical protein